MKNFIALTMLTFVAFSANAGGSLDLALRNDAVRIEHEAAQVGSGALFTVGGAYTETGEYFLSAGFSGIDTTSDNLEWVGGVGVKAVVWASSDTHFSGAVGGFARYTPDYMNGMGLEGSVYYSPAILSFMGAESFQELFFRVNYKILPQARVFLGYHDFSGSSDTDSNFLIDQGLHFGFRINY